MTNAIRRMDIWLLFYVFMRLSHWVDYRFHRNQYDLAANVMSVGMALNLAQTAQALINNWRLGLISVLSSVVVVASYYTHIKQLHRASAAYERRPDQIPREGAIFFLLPYVIRMTTLFIGLQIWAAFIFVLITLRSATHAVDAITFGWMTAVGCAMYIASGLPPTRERKKKRVRAPMGAALTPAH